MLISKKWLSQYMDVSDVNIDDLAKKITSAGLEVEGIERLAVGSNLVIGEVLKCEPHPDSDHLNVCEVDIKSEKLQIVCGAPNCRIGIKVIVAKVGAKLPEIEIKKGSIRGVESNGMLCSLLELGVDEKQLNNMQKEGIEELSQDAIVGDEDVLAYLGLDDEILDIGLTPNRNDCLAAFSMALEVGAVLNRKVTLPDYIDKANEGVNTNLKIESKTDKCPLYCGKIIRNIIIKESPAWMKQLLQSSGIKSINNVVDISNLVMLETGQPLHFFDLSKLEKEEIIVADGFHCNYNALDENEYHILEEDIMITCNGSPIAIAGIMGGNDTKIDEDTKSILIETASFHTVSIRNSSRRLNLSTDASIRFQKGIEPTAPYHAMDRAVDLLIQYADASGLEETIYSNGKKIEIKEKQIYVSVDRINYVLGTSFDESSVIDVLNRLYLQPVKQEDQICVTIPTYRQDLEIEADIAEEVIRILGFDDLPSTLPLMSDTSGGLNERQQLRRLIRTMFSNQGFYEATTYTLISEILKNDAIMPLDSNVSLASPMSEDRKFIRGSILPSLLTSVAYNKARSIKHIPLFEISNVYANNYVEERFAIAMSGNLQENRWQKFAIEPTFYTIKGLVEMMLDKIGFNGSRIMIKENTLDVDHFHPYQSACVYIGKDLLGVFGVIHPNMAKTYSVDTCIIAELNLEVILNNKTSKLKFVPVSKYPQVTRDLAFVVKAEVNVDEIVKLIKSCGKTMIQNIEVFDVYTGEHVEKGMKSIALSIVFQASDRTLKDDEINEVHEKILVSLKNKLNAELRG